MTKVNCQQIQDAIESARAAVRLGCGQVRGCFTRVRVIAVLAPLTLGGCFDLTANSQFQTDGTARVDVEFAMSMQLAAVAASMGKDGQKADLLSGCDDFAKGDTALAPGVRSAKAVRGTRGEMITCTVHLEVDDPITAVRQWRTKGMASHDGLSLEELQFDRLGAGSYRLAAVLRARTQRAEQRQEENPFKAVVAAAMLNHYVTISVTAARIENATGEISDDGRRVTWKFPILMIVNPPKGYSQDIRADIIYEDGWLDSVASWFGRVMRTVGLSSSSTKPTVDVPSTNKAAPPNLDAHKKLQVEQLSLLENVVITKPRFWYRSPDEEIVKAYKRELDKLLEKHKAKYDALDRSEDAELEELKQQHVLGVPSEEIARLKAKYLTLGEKAKAEGEAEAKAIKDKVREAMSQATANMKQLQATSEPVLSFSIENKGNVAVKRIFVEGTVGTAGRAVPLLKASFTYEIRGGLEPNEVQEFDLVPTMPSEWTSVSKEEAKSAVLVLKLIAFEDAAGKRFGGDDQTDYGIAMRKVLEPSLQP